MTGGAHKLGIAGSGKKLGDARNIPNVTAMNLAYKYNTSITYSASAGSPATATISVAAGTVYVGSTSVSYNAMSVGVSGTSGTVVQYYLYLDDAGNAGGTQTLVATTDPLLPYQNSGRVYVGTVQVAFPASGGSSGGGDVGGGNCVADDAWVETRDRGFVLARDILPGDFVRVLNETLDGTRWEAVTENRVSLAHGWCITSARGHTLRLSQTTPICIRDGSYISVSDIDGHELPIYVHGEFGWEPCTAKFIGALKVAHIRCSQQVYAAGDVRGLSILTHNPTLPKP
jgi:hypothetical protein